MLLRSKATVTAKSPGGLLSRQATFTTTPVIQKKPLETIKDLDSKLKAKIISEGKFTNKDVTEFIKDKIKAINNIDDY